MTTVRVGRLVGMNTQSPAGTSARAWPATTVAVLAALAALASLVMTVAHLDISVPPLMEGVDVPPFVPGGFAVATILCAIVAFGALRTARWAWWMGVIVFALAVLVILGSPARNWLSYVVLGASVLSIGILVAPPGRAAFGMKSEGA